MTQLLDEMPRMDILADVRGSPNIALSAVGEEIGRLPLVFRMIRQTDDPPALISYFRLP